MSKDYANSIIGAGNLGPLSLENSFKGKAKLIGESQTAQQSLHSLSNQ